MCDHKLQDLKHVKQNAQHYIQSRALNDLKILKYKVNFTNINDQFDSYRTSINYWLKLSLFLAFVS